MKINVHSHLIVLVYVEKIDNKRNEFVIFEFVLGSLVM